MNRLKIFQERKRVLDQIRFGNKSGLHANCFRAYASESEVHIRLKFEVWLKLVKEGYEVWAEPIFNNGSRADIIAFKEGIWTGFEVIFCERREECQEKIKKYPMEIDFQIIKSQKDIENLLV